MMGFRSAISLARNFLLKSGSSKLMAHYRIASRFSKGGPLNRAIANFISIRATRIFGVYISEKALISEDCIFPHPVGIVIGKGAVVGKGCVIYQHVTLGAQHVTVGVTGAGEGDEGRYPILEDGVVVYAGAVIVGGIRIGEGAVVGANAVVTSDIPPRHVAAGVPAKTWRRAQPAATSTAA